MLWKKEVQHCKFVWPRSAVSHSVVQINTNQTYGPTIHFRFYSHVSQWYFSWHWLSVKVSGILILFKKRQYSSPIKCSSWEAFSLGPKFWLRKQTTIRYLWNSISIDASLSITIATVDYCTGLQCTELNGLLAFVIPPLWVDIIIVSWHLCCRKTDIVFIVVVLVWS